MRIGELGKATGVAVETIRYYEKAGLLVPPARHANGIGYTARHIWSDWRLFGTAGRSTCLWPQSSSYWIFSVGLLPNAATWIT